MKRFGRLARVFAAVVGIAVATVSPGQADTYVAGSTVVVRQDPGAGTAADSGFVECSTAPAPSTGGACIPWTAGGNAIKVVDQVNGTAVAFQVCVDNDGNQQCGGTPTIAGCDDDVVYSHFDNGSFSNPLAAPTSFRTGCPGGYRGWVVILCQGAHASGGAHTHEVTEGTVTSVTGGGPSGEFCGPPPGVPGKPYFLGRPPSNLCAGGGVLTTGPLGAPFLAATASYSFSLTFSGACTSGTSLTVNGSITGSCGAAEGSGTVNGQPHRFLFRVTGIGMTVIPVGPEGAVGSLFIAPATGESCLTGADQFLVNGFLGYL